jgi:hypothetical protein
MDRLKPVRLLLEQVFEGLAGVAGARRRGRRRAGTCGLCIGSGRGVFLDGHAEFVERAIVLGVFGRDALFNRLRAFELRARIEKAALLAAMQFELALGALPVGIEAGSQDGAAIGTARASDGSDHARGARTELIGTTRTARRRLLFVRTLALLTFLRIAVTAMTILAIHKHLRPPALTDCNGYNLNFCAQLCANLACVQLDCYTRPDCAMPS